MAVLLADGAVIQLDIPSVGAICTAIVTGLGVGGRVIGWAFTRTLDRLVRHNKTLMDEVMAAREREISVYDKTTAVLDSAFKAIRMMSRKVGMKDIIKKFERRRRNAKADTGNHQPKPMVDSDGEPSEAMTNP